jgi:hypothetical protein
MKIFINLEEDDVLFVVGDMQYIFYPNVIVGLEEVTLRKNFGDLFGVRILTVDFTKGMQPVKSYAKLQEILHEHYN